MILFIYTLNNYIHHVVFEVQFINLKKNDLKLLQIKDKNFLKVK